MICYSKHNKKGIRTRTMGLFNLFKKKQAAPVEHPKSPNVASQSHGHVTWTDVQNPSRSVLRDFAEKHALHAVHVDLALNDGQIAQLSEEGDYVFLLLYIPYFIPEENKIATSQVSMFLGKDYLLTTHASHVPSIRTLFEQYANTATSDTKTPGRILFHLINTLLEDIKHLTENISLELDSIEDKVFDSEISDAKQIGQMRQMIIRLRRTLATQRSVLGELDKIIDKFTGEHLHRYYGSNTNTSNRLWETLEEARETVEIYKDVDFTTSTERTNDILAILTIFFTLAIPATLFGTFYGMNVPLPGGIEAGPWTFFGEYTTLAVIIAASVTPAIIMWVWFKKKKWF